jgi:hypothetical protein
MGVYMAYARWREYGKKAAVFLRNARNEAMHLAGNGLRIGVNAAWRTAPPKSVSQSLAATR